VDLFLGYNLKANVLTNEKFVFPAEDLLTHTFICGSTGSGKTVLGKILVEEAARASIPSIMIDLKGDLSSLAIPVSNVDYHEIRDWVEARTDEEIYQKAQEVVTDFRNRLTSTGLSQDDVRTFRSNIEVRILTPKSHLGEPFCFSLTGEKPQLSSYESAGGKETLIHSASVSAQALIERAYVDNERSGKVEEKRFLEELILHLWSDDANLEGKEGLVTLIKHTTQPPFNTVGVMSVNDFLPPGRRRDLARRLNSLLVGSESLWFEGETMTSILRYIDDPDRKRTPIVIFNLSMLGSFQEKNLILSHIASSVSTWMRKKVKGTGPRIVFYLDEIGEGKQSFFPAEPFHCASKEALNILLRQGRAFGVCCILSTQNPGDIDYKGLTNCHTWFVGKLLTREDRSKVMQGISSFEYFATRFEDYIKTSDVGQFVVKTKFGRVLQFKERWLLSIHRVLSPEDYEKLYRTLKWSRFRERAQALIDSAKHAEALAYLDKLLKERPRLAQAWALKGKVHELQDDKQAALKAYEKVLSLERHDSETWFRMALLYISMNEASQALFALDEAIASNEQHDLAWLEKGKLLYSQDKIDAAKDSLTQATRINSRLAEGWEILSRISEGQNDYIRSLEYLARAINLSPGVIRLLVKKGSLYLMSNDPFSALKTFEYIIEKYPENTEALHGQAMTLLEIGEKGKAADIIQQALTVNPRNLNNGVLYARLKEDEGQFEEALGTLEKLISWHPDSPLPLLRSAACHLGLEHLDQATALIDKTLSLEPDLGEAWLLKGAILEKSGQSDEAGTAYEKAVGCAPDLPEALRQKASFHKKLGEWKKALDTFGKLLTLEPGDEDAWYGKAMALEHLEKFSDAIAALQHVETLAQYPDIWAHRARLFAATSQWTRSREAFEKAIKKNPSDDFLRLENGIVLRELNQFEKALDNIDIFVKQHPDDTMGWKEMGATFRAMGDSRRAGHCFEKVAELDEQQNSGTT